MSAVVILSRCTDTSGDILDVDAPQVPNVDEEQHAHCVHSILQSLCRVAVNDDAHYHLSHALHAVSLSAAKRTGPRLSIIDRETLLQKASCIRTMVGMLFARGYDKGCADRGLSALAILLDHWTGDGEEKRVTASSARDAFDHIRILRNLCHNISLENAIINRAQARTSAAYQPKGRDNQKVIENKVLNDCRPDAACSFQRPTP